MISYLYNNDLESINSMITEINRELGKTSSSESPTIGATRLIGEHEVGSPSTELVVENIHLSLAEEWVFYAHMINGNSSPDYYLYFNNDRNSDHYKRVRFLSANGAAVSADQATNSLIAGVDPNCTITVSGEILLVADTKNVFVNIRSYLYPNETLSIETIRYTLLPEHNDIFKLEIVSTIANAMTKKSHLKLLEAN